MGCGQSKESTMEDSRREIELQSNAVLANNQQRVHPGKNIVTTRGRLGQSPPGRSETQVKLINTRPPPPADAEFNMQILHDEIPAEIE